MLKRLEIAGFKSFARKTVLDFSAQATAIVGPNGSGKSNVAEAFRFALGEQSMKSMRGKRSEDLIFAGSHMAPRANRAAVTIVFDNTPAAKRGGRLFPKLDFDEVSIERAVFRDGSSEYSINSSKARLRDIQELLASANIGQSAHHIISQGEADRILVSAPRERRAMLEDALGLKVFEFKKQEAERKLEKTEDNVKQVEALRREIAPHIRFLSKQVEKLERADELRRELEAAYQTYFAIEETYVRVEREKAEIEKARAAERLARAVEELAVFEKRTTHDTEGLKRTEAVRQAEREVDRLATERGQVSREAGRIEGALEAAKRRSLQVARDPYVKVSRDDLQALKHEIDRQSEVPEHAEPLALRAALISIHHAITAFFDRFSSPNDDYIAEEEQAVFKYENELKGIMEREAVLASKLEDARGALLRAREAVFAYEETGREERHRVLELAETKAQEEAAVARLESHLQALNEQKDAFERERREAVAIVGHVSVTYQAREELPKEERRVQEDRLRAIDRLKIRLEEAGGAGEDVRTEYKDAVEREAFLARELEDLAKSAASLRLLITDLDQELTKSFNDGLHKVNASFSEFFALMFGGGSAKLVLEETSQPSEDDEDYEELVAENAKQKPGIEISVALPKKRVQSLMQLSGGERALTSIALIFAMSQVNPPPFLILDETDAALDEANSRRYGDMIANLAKKSQLIVITHNRETMSRAGILYGVTMGADGISKLLSVRFEDAVAVAK
ncbi:MAG: AAA family ATPase [Candidatus Pacebacteria bacterium]|nr:AAA family ATPase [Candidatus Paceibacterota bacterium]